MGYSAYSYAVFGVKTDISSVNQTNQKRSCNHDVKPNMKFCPECGKPTFVEKTVFLLDSMEDKKLSYFYSDPESKDNIVLGFRLAATSYNTNCTPIEIPNPTPVMIEEIMQFCKENNLPFKEKDCKMYVMTYHSY
jgi:hypothetical protein